MTTQGTLLLGGAVILSAIGIIGSADLKQLEQHQTKCCHVLNKSFEMMMNDSEHAFDQIKSLQEAIRQLCDLVSFDIMIGKFIFRVFRWSF